jgi:hypothetical protein
MYNNLNNEPILNKILDSFENLVKNFGKEPVRIMSKH